MYTTSADLVQTIETLTGEYRFAAVTYIDYLAQAQKSHAKIRQEPPPARTKKRQFGSAKGKFVCPQDFDEDNEEIARLFGAV